MKIKTKKVEVKTEEMEVKTKEVVEKTEEVVEKTEEVVEKTEDMEVKTEEVVEKTEEVIEKTEEMEVKTKEMPGTSSQTMKTSHHREIITFANDENAATTDPKQMERNYTFPWNAVTINNGKVSVEQLDEVVLVVSPEFAASFRGGVFKKLFETTGKRKLLDGNEREKLKRMKYRPVATAGVNILTAIPKLKPAHKKKRRVKRKSQKATHKMAADDTSEIECLIVAEFSEAGVGVSLESVKRLAPLQELNGELVDFAMCNTLKSFPIFGYVLACAWLLYLFKNDDPLPARSRDLLYKTVTKWGKEPDLLKKKFLIFPVCRENHWLLVIVCNPFPIEADVKAASERIAQGCNPEWVSKHLYERWTNYDGNLQNAVMMFVLDSKYKFMKRSYANFSQLHADTVRYIFKGLSALHQAHWEKTGCGIPVDMEVFEWRQQVNPETNQVIQRNSIHHHSLEVTEQPNQKDCGVYIIEFAKKWISKAGNDCRSYIPLINQNLDDWFNPETVMESRLDIYNDIVERCKQTHPSSLKLLEQYHPLATQKIEPTTD